MTRAIIVGNHTFSWILGCLFVTGVCALGAVCGCGDDDEDGSEMSTDSGGDTDADVDTDTDTDEASSVEVSCNDAVDEDEDGMTDCDDPDCDLVPEVEGACVNESDLEAMRFVDYNMAWNECVAFQGCMWDIECNTTCFQETLSYSEGCARCFAEMVECWITNCASECPNGGASEECQICASTYCKPDYATCVGQLLCKYEFACGDMGDNDGDGLTDYEDPDCFEMDK